MQGMSSLEKLTKVQFTNLDKVLYPEAHVTKAQVVEYYIRMAPGMLSILADRPVVLARFPDGIGKEGFYEKDLPLGAPSWVRRFKRYSETALREISYVVCGDLDTLVWLANLAALELHVTLSRVDEFEKPDLVLFDIDPEPPASMNDVVDVALLVKEKLDALGLRCYVKTSGKKGLHIVVPIVREYMFSQTREFVHQIGEYLARESSIVVSEFSRPKKPGTVYLDYLQNSHGRTMVCPYSLRAVPQATVAVPLDWKDVKKGLKSEEFTLFSAVEYQSNPWKGLLEDRQKLGV
jgi:bifunctional non-homologous end joining protein LigD